LVGDTGTGKTTLIRELARESGKDLIRINLTGQTGVDDLIGKHLANKNGTYWIDGLLVDAMKKGRWVVLDEINMALPEILAKLHSLLDDDHQIVLTEKEGEIIHPHPDFRFFATMNPDDEYAGTKELNKAFLSRFPVVLHVNYSEQEEKIIAEQGGVDDVTAKVLVRVAHEIRAAKAKGMLSYTCSTRDIIYCANLIKNGLDRAVAIETSLVNKAVTEERGAISKIIELITSEVIKVDNGQQFKSFEDLIKDYNSKDKVTQGLRADVSNRDRRISELELALNESNDKLGLEQKDHLKTKASAKKMIAIYEKLTQELNADETTKT